MTIIRDGLQSADLDFPVAAPTLNLDFANSQSLDERITFTRASVGTYVNKNGFISIASTNQPRFDYDPISGECKGLLIEEQRKNIFTYSQDLNNWYTSQSTVQSNVVTSPDGTLNADKIIGNSGIKDRQGIFNNASVTTGVTYTYSVFLKAAERKYACIFFDSPNISEGAYYGASTIVNLETGSFVANNSNSTITPYPNNWYRISISATPTVTTTMAFDIVVGSPNNFLDNLNPYNFVRYNGDGNSGIYVWGAQFEEGKFATSYIPTDSTAGGITRSADVASMSETNFSNWYNQNEGTIYMESKIPYTPGPVYSSVYFIIFGLNQNYRHLVQQGTSNEIGYFTQNGDYTLSWSTPDPIIPPNTNRKFTYSYSSLNNINILSGTSNQSYNFGVKFPTSVYKSMDRLLLGRYNDSNILFLNGTIGKFRYYPKALSPAQLQFLTQ